MESDCDALVEKTIDSGTKLLSFLIVNQPCDHW